MELWIPAAISVLLLIWVLIKPKSAAASPELDRIRTENEELKILLARAEERGLGLSLEKERVMDDLRAEREKLALANQSLESSRSYYKAQQEKIAEQKAEIEKVQEKFNKDFELIAS